MTGPAHLAAEDRLDIVELMASYALYLDQFDMERWLGVFTPDAVMEAPGMEPVRSHEDRLQMARTAPKGVHMCAAPVISPGPGPDEAVVEQSFLFRSQHDGGILSGWYADRVVKQEGRWYIAERRVQYYRRSRGRPDR